MQYTAQFNIPPGSVGFFAGRNGWFITKLRENYNATIDLNKLVIKTDNKQDIPRIMEDLRKRMVQFLTNQSKHAYGATLCPSGTARVRFIPFHMSESHGGKHSKHDTMSIVPTVSKPAEPATYTTNEILAARGIKFGVMDEFAAHQSVFDGLVTRHIEDGHQLTLTLMFGKQTFINVPQETLDLADARSMFSRKTASDIDPSFHRMLSPENTGRVVSALSRNGFQVYKNKPANVTLYYQDPAETKDVSHARQQVECIDSYYYDENEGAYVHTRHAVRNQRLYFITFISATSTTPDVRLCLTARKEAPVDMTGHDGDAVLRTDDSGHTTVNIRGGTYPVVSERKKTQRMYHNRQKRMFVNVTTVSQRDHDKNEDNDLYVELTMWHESWPELSAETDLAVESSVREACQLAQCISAYIDTK